MIVLFNNQCVCRPAPPDSRLPAGSFASCYKLQHRCGRMGRRGGCRKANEARRGLRTSFGHHCWGMRAVRSGSLDQSKLSQRGYAIIEADLL
jgi:hypothetical protein